jgi:hypothetical protein
MHLSVKTDRWDYEETYLKASLLVMDIVSPPYPTSLHPHLNPLPQGRGELKITLSLQRDEVKVILFR